MREDAADRVGMSEYHTPEGAPEGRAGQRDTYRAPERNGLRVARTWAGKKRFRQPRESRRLAAARKPFAPRSYQGNLTCLRPMRDAISRIHTPTSVLTCPLHGITNAGPAVAHATFQWVKETDRGFPSPDHINTPNLLPVRRTEPPPARELTRPGSFSPAHIICLTALTYARPGYATPYGDTTSGRR